MFNIYFIVATVVAVIGFLCISGYIALRSSIRDLAEAVVDAFGINIKVKIGLMDRPPGIYNRWILEKKYRVLVYSSSGPLLHCMESLDLRDARRLCTEINRLKKQRADDIVVKRKQH